MSSQYNKHEDWARQQIKTLEHSQHAEFEWGEDAVSNVNCSLLTFPSSSNTLQSDLVKQRRKQERKW